jgi:prepilin-type N-terminal cleavage/methylation domain-containing protein
MRRGYTLFELTLVMAIMLIIAALASPLLFDGIYQDTKVGAAADLVRARWTECRSQAIEEGRPYCFWVVPNTGKWKIEPYNLDTGDNSDIDPLTTSGASTLAKGLIKEGRLPEGIRFMVNAGNDAPMNVDGDEPEGGDYVPVAIFLADGTAKDDVEITFASKGGGMLKVQLRALTGTSITVRPQAGDGN